MSKKIVLIIIPLLFIGASVLFYIGYSKRNLTGPITVFATALYNNAPVFLDDTLVGNTPYKGQKDISGPLKIAVKGQNSKFETQISPSPGTEVSIKRDLGIDPQFSSGQLVWLEKSSSKNPTVMVISKPSGATVKLDGVEVGQTPTTLGTKDILVPNKDYKIEVFKEGFEDQAISISPKKGYLVNASLDLFLLPQERPAQEATSPETSLFKSYIFESKILFGKVATPLWINALDYFSKTRKVVLPAFDFFVDGHGDFYKQSGEKVDLDQVELTKKEGEKYLIGVFQESGQKVEEKAETTLNLVFNKTERATSETPSLQTPSKKATVKETGTDFGLNVRKGAGSGFEKIGTIKVGTVVDILDEQNGFAKIAYEGKEGWVSLSYLQKN